MTRLKVRKKIQIRSFSEQFTILIVINCTRESVATYTFFTLLYRSIPTLSSGSGNRLVETETFSVESFTALLVKCLARLLSVPRPARIFESRFVLSSLFQNQRNTLRDRRPSTAASPPAAGPMGTRELKKCTMRKKYFVLGRLEQPRQNKNLLDLHDKPNEPTKERPLSYVLLEPHSPQFQQSGHPSLVSLVRTIRNVQQSIK
jgi:hypothetical protein